MLALERTPFSPCSASSEIPPADRSLVRPNKISPQRHGGISELKIKGIPSSTDLHLFHSHHNPPSIDSRACSTVHLHIPTYLNEQQQACGFIISSLCSRSCSRCNMSTQKDRRQPSSSWIRPTFSLSRANTIWPFKALTPPSVNITPSFFRCAPVAIWRVQNVADNLRGILTALFSLSAS